MLYKLQHFMTETEDTFLHTYFGKHSQSCNAETNKIKENRTFRIEFHSKVRNNGRPGRKPKSIIFRRVSPHYRSPFRRFEPPSSVQILVLKKIQKRVDVDVTSDDPPPRWRRVDPILRKPNNIAAKPILKANFAWKK